MLMLLPWELTNTSRVPVAARNVPRNQSVSSGGRVRLGSMTWTVGPRSVAEAAVLLAAPPASALSYRSTFQFGQQSIAQARLRNRLHAARGYHGVAEG